MTNMLSRENQKPNDVANTLNSIGTLLEVDKRNPEAIALGLGITFGLFIVAALLNSGGNRNVTY